MTWDGQKGHPDEGMTHRVVMHMLLVCIQERLWTLSHTKKFVESANLQKQKKRRLHCTNARKTTRTTRAQNQWNQMQFYTSVKMR